MAGGSYPTSHGCDSAGRPSRGTMAPGGRARRDPRAVEPVETPGGRARRDPRAVEDRPRVVEPVETPGWSSPSRPPGGRARRDPQAVEPVETPGGRGPSVRF